MIALLKYGTGMPFHSLERLQGNLGIPLPVATQWEIVEESGDQIEPALEELIRQAAQGQIFHNDDAGMKVLTLMDPTRAATAAPSSTRQSVSTSGLLSVPDGPRIALFFTGHRNAGENLTLVLQQRAAALDRPIHMCDALPQNLPDLPPELQTILAHCLTHARRHFVDVAMNFPEECLYVLKALQVVYANDVLAQEQGMTAHERLEFHQAQS
jgi:hypothetical protein